MTTCERMRREKKNDPAMPRERACQATWLHAWESLVLRGLCWSRMALKRRAQEPPATGPGRFLLVEPLEERAKAEFAAMHGTLPMLGRNARLCLSSVPRGPHGRGA
jgi:hypothetical protein